MSGFYAVHKGNVPGVYTTWDEARKQVHQYGGAVYKKFGNKEDAEKFYKEGPSSFGTSNKRPAGDFRKCPPAKKVAILRDLEDGEMEIYADGACEGNGTQSAIAGYGIWFGKDDPRNVSGAVPGKQTNQRAELYAVIRTLVLIKLSMDLLMKTYRKITIRTDSTYAVNCKRDIPYWKERGWIKSDGSPTSNTDFLELMDEYFSELPNVNLEHVRGHSGIKGNVEADALARNGMKIAASMLKDSESKIEPVVPRKSPTNKDKHGSPIKTTSL